MQWPFSPTQHLASSWSLTSVSHKIPWMEPQAITHTFGCVDNFWWILANFSRKEPDQTRSSLPFPVDVADSSGAGAVLGSSAVTLYGSVGDEGRRSLRYVPLAVAPRLAVQFMQAAVGGEWVVEPRHATVEIALRCVSQKVAPERVGNVQKWGQKQGDGGGMQQRGFSQLPVITSAA